MCDLNKYKEMYHEIRKLTPDDTLALVLDAADEEEQEFFELIGDFLLQTEQRKCIEMHIH